MFILLLISYWMHFKIGSLGRPCWLVPRANKASIDTFSYTTQSHTVSIEVSLCRQSALSRSWHLSWHLTPHSEQRMPCRAMPTSSPRTRSSRWAWWPSTPRSCARGAGDGVDQSLQRLLIHVTLLQEHKTQRYLGLDTHMLSFTLHVQISF